ncbi:MAG: ECF transporter S component [Anaerolineales bacterium]|nr:ECF transporter S component [Anaerolineales bacterium]MCB8953660.1 ECF transporter S component [Ardenticatenales bacterium]
MTHRLLSFALYLLSGCIGLVAFTYPFFLNAAQLQQFAGQQQAAPLLTMILITMCLLILLLEMQGQAVSAKVVAALGVLVAVTAVLRFLEVAIPGPGGFSPIFAPIILAGFVFGPRFGFLMGALTLLVSALLTGGVGPWLPYQMFAAGWVGLTAGWLPQLRRPLPLLALFGFAWGLLFGLLMNLTFWPFAVGMAGAGWEPGLGVVDGMGRYLAFYAGTSLLWDLVRAGGNVALLLILGMPAIHALARFRDRFQFVRDEV